MKREKKKKPNKTQSGKQDERHPSVVAMFLETQTLVSWKSIAAESLSCEKKKRKWQRAGRNAT